MVMGSNPTHLMIYVLGQKEYFDVWKLTIFDIFSMQLTINKCRIKIIFLKMGQPWPLFFIFGLFKQTIQFFNKSMWKNVRMSIQYTALGFEPTTFQRWAAPITTRPGLTLITLVQSFCLTLHNTPSIFINLWTVWYINWIILFISLVNKWITYQQLL